MKKLFGWRKRYCVDTNMEVQGENQRKNDVRLARIRLDLAEKGCHYCPSFAPNASVHPGAPVGSLPGPLLSSKWSLQAFVSK